MPKHTLQQSGSHLVSKIIKDHIDDNKCELMSPKTFDSKSYTLKVLDNLIVYGEFTRELVLTTDLLLRKELSQVDILFNLRGLTKIQSNHIRKYHSTKKSQSIDAKCIYWQHYLHKFTSKTSDKLTKLIVFGYFHETMKLCGITIPIELFKLCLLFYNGTEMMKFHNNPFIFNAKFFVKILQSSQILKNKLTIDDNSESCIKCIINNDILYESYNLKGFTMTFSDVFYPNKILHDTDIKTKRWKPIAVMPDSTQYQKYLELKELKIPIYPFRIVSKLSALDFSCHCCIIPLSSITEFCDSEPVDAPNIAIWFWEYIVENGIDSCNSIKDVLVEKVLQLPFEDHDGKILKRIYPKCDHFWRIVKVAIELSDFSIDDNLVKIHINNYNEWLNKSYFNDERNQTQFLNEFGNVLLKQCKYVHDVKRMFDVFETLKFNGKFNKLLIKMKGFNEKFRKMIQSIDDQKIIDVLQNYMDL